jgi:hypothetical protein
MAIPTSTGASDEKSLWFDRIFLALILLEWVLLLFIVLLKPVTGRYLFALPLLWGRLMVVFLVFVAVPYLIFQGWLLYQKIAKAQDPYRPKIRKATALLFIITIPINYLGLYIMICLDRT